MSAKIPLKSEQLQQIRKREQEATPGPWTVHEQVLNAFSTDRIITTAWENEKTGWPQPIMSISQSDKGPSLWISETDASFMASAREDVAQLLDSLDVFGHRVVYDALLRSCNSPECNDTDRRVLERAIDTCWQIINGKSVR